MQREYDLFLDFNTSDTEKVFGRISLESLFRLNPHWIIQSFTSSGENYEADLEDHESGEKIPLRGSYLRDEEGLPAIQAENNLWHAINFREKNGSLHAVVSYSEPPEEDQERQLVLWLRSIKEYLRLYSKSTLNTRFFRLLMNRVILPMTPSQRKISLMLTRITILEIVVILIILVGWFVFFR